MGWRRTWIAGSQPPPTGLAAQSTAKALGTLWAEGRLTWAGSRAAPSGLLPTRPQCSPLPLWSLSVFPVLPSPRDSLLVQTGPCFPHSAPSLAPALICTQKHTNSSSVLCMHSISFWKILWATSVTGIIMWLILPLAVKWWWVFSWNCVRFLVQGRWRGRQRKGQQRHLLQHLPLQKVEWGTCSSVAGLWGEQVGRGWDALGHHWAPSKPEASAVCAELQKRKSKLLSTRARPPALQKSFPL